MAKKKARIYYATEESGFETNYDEFNSLEEAQKNEPNGDYDGLDSYGYEVIIRVVEQGHYRDAIRDIAEKRREFMEMF